MLTSPSKRTGQLLLALEMTRQQASSATIKQRADIGDTDLEALLVGKAVVRR